MTKQIINTGATANDGLGDSLRSGAAKINANFNQLYANLGNGSTLQFAVDFAATPTAGQTLQYNSTTGKFVPAAAGTVGPQGPQGPTGLTGAVGPQGPAGLQGTASTIPGPPGTKGDQGDPGAKGDQGDPGAKGDQGDPGASGAGTGDVNSTGGGYANNAVIRYDGTTGTAIQTSLVTVADNGAITAPNNTGSMIPFYYADAAAFPTAADSHGALAHNHADGKMYYAHAGLWIELANMTDIVSGVGTVTSVGGTGSVNGLTLTGTVTSTGNLTLGGTLAIAATQVTSGTLPVARGGTGTTAPALVAGTNVTISGTWPNQTINATTTASSTIAFVIGASGTSDYVFQSGPGFPTNTNDPVLYLYRGFTYTFNNTTGGSHPFAIRVSNGGALYTSGVSGSQTGTQTFVVPMNAPSTLYYQCTLHSGMGNVINIV